MAHSKLPSKLGLAAVAIALTLLLCEAALRGWVCLHAGSAAPFFKPVLLDTRIEQADPVLNHALIPAIPYVHTGIPRGLEFCVSGRINRMGMNDDEIDPATPPAAPRVLVLGDSFVEAKQVLRPNNFCEQLQARLRRELGTPVEVINAGVSSYSPILEYLNFKTRLRSLRPNVVVVAFFANDVFDDLRYSQAATFDSAGRPLAVSAGVPWLSLQRNTGNDARLYRKAFDTIRYAPPSTLGSISYLCSTIEQSWALRLLHEEFPDPPRSDEFFSIDTDPSLESLQQQGWQLSRNYLSMLSQECSQAGAQMILCSVPIAAQVLQQSARGTFSGPAATDADHRHVRAIAAELGLPYVDLLTPLRQASGRLYYPRDGHWTPRGHKIAADTLYPVVLKTLAKQSQ